MAVEEWVCNKMSLPGLVNTSCEAVSVDVEGELWLFGVVEALMVSHGTSYNKHH